MDNLNKTSLFSLEVVVDNLTITRPPALHKNAVSKDAHLPVPHDYYRSVGCCRFPTVAFRFLDFPTLLVTHVDDSLANNIKSKIDADSSYKVPLQLPELQDKDGKFVLKKGKSCLFKTTVETLLHHLSHTPLYVLVTDTYPSVPKLIGNCMLPLTETMRLIYDDICKYGLSTPSTHGGKGTFEICNLMGSAMGSITFAYRLLSLGPGLLSHIPDTAIAKPIIDIEGAPIVEKETHMITETAECADHTPVIKPRKKHINPAKVQDNLLKAIDRSTQTLKNQKSYTMDRNKHGLKIAKQNEDDFFIVNTVCPPPLFYNHEADALSSNEDQRCVLQSVENLCSPSECSFDEGTIRAEDRASDDGDLAHTEEDWDSKFAEHLLKHQEPRPIPLTNQKAEQKAVPVVLPHAISQFPVLSALFSELLAFNPNVHHDVDVVKSMVAKPFESPRPASQYQRKPIAMESTRQFLTRISKPKYAVDETQRSAVKVTKHQRPSTANNKRKTSLVFGMTNTQKLRLAKTNPDLLAELERKEHKRVEQWRVLHAQQSDRKAQDSHKTNVISDQGNVSPVDKLDIIEEELHSRPIPTPRKSIRRLAEKPNDIYPENEPATNDNTVSKELSATSTVDSVSPNVTESKSYSISTNGDSGDDDDDASNMLHSPLQNLLNVGSLVASCDDVTPQPTLHPTHTYSGIDVDAGIAYDFSRVNKLSMTGEQLRHSADISESFEPELQKIVDQYDDDDDGDEDEHSESAPHSDISEPSVPSDKPPLSWSTDARGITPRPILASTSQPKWQVDALQRTAVVKPSTRSLRSRSTSSGDGGQSPQAHYSDSFEESISSMRSEHSEQSDYLPALGTLSDIKLASQAHFGYTWAHPN